MGCNEKVKKLIIVSFFVTLVVVAVGPQTIMGATKEVINVSFDPTGTIDLDVSPGVVNYSTVENGTNEDSVSLTLYNNGTIGMDTDINTSATTDPDGTGDLTLDPDGQPGEDLFSLKVVDTTFDGNDNWITAGGVELDNNLAGAGGSGTFEIQITMGPISVDHGWQTIDVKLTGTAST